MAGVATDLRRSCNQVEGELHEAGCEAPSASRREVVGRWVRAASGWWPASGTLAELRTKVEAHGQRGGGAWGRGAEARMPKVEDDTGREEMPH